MSAREICGHKPKSVTGEGNRTPGIDQSQWTTKPEVASSEAHGGWISEQNQGY